MMMNSPEVLVDWAEVPSLAGAILEYHPLGLVPLESVLPAVLALAGAILEYHPLGLVPLEPLGFVYEYRPVPLDQAK